MQLGVWSEGDNSLSVAVSIMRKKTICLEKCSLFFFLLILQHIGQVIDFGNLTGGFKSLLTKLKRPALKWLQNQAIAKVSDLIPDDSLLAPFKNLSLTFLRNINTNASNLKNLFTPGW